jgi:cell division protease FtsH
VSDDVDLSVLARGTPGFSGADLENMVNEAALLAARFDKDRLEMVDFEEAKDKVLMGTARKSMIISEREKRNTAYHEAGHTLVAKMIPETDPIHKVTIIPRGRALGLTQQLPVDEKHTYPRRYLLDTLAVLMGGRAAEELVLEEMTSGAANDIERATETARKMVCLWGMSDKLGPVAFGQKDEQIFLGREFAQHKDYSEETAVLIDQEIRGVVTAAYEKAKKILTENMNTLHAIAEALLERETLVEKEIEAIIAGDLSKSTEAEEEETESDPHTKDETMTPGKLKPLPS